MRHFLVFGTHPHLSLAECKAVLGGPKPELAGVLAVLDPSSWDGAVLQHRLAGTIKLGDVVWEGNVSALTGLRVGEFIEQRPRGERVLFGLTIYGGSEPERKRLKNLPIDLKRTLQERGRSVRWVTGEKGPLSPAAIAKLKLTTEGYDFVIGIFGDRAIVGLTTHVQDADAWSERDYGRPFRDTKTGMLPPKLARLMVNLALGSNPPSSIRNAVILDPFCGVGTVLMEAALLLSPNNHGAKTVDLIGSDIDARQIAGAQKNLDWLVKRRLIRPEVRERIRLVVSSVETLATHVRPASIPLIVTEGYLGKPLGRTSDRRVLLEQKRDVEALWRRALPVLARLQPKGGKMVCVWPEYPAGRETLRVDLTDALPSFGYQAVDPLAGWRDTHAPLVYARPDQRVRRRIVILERLD